MIHVTQYLYKFGDPGIRTEWEAGRGDSLLEAMSLNIAIVGL
jgi:hypothetical protein